MKKLMAFFKEEKGAGMVEYGLLVALIAVALITVLTSVGTSLQGLFQQVINAL